jgi:hypothetical protein
LRYRGGGGKKERKKNTMVAQGYRLFEGKTKRSRQVLKKKKGTAEGNPPEKEKKGEKIKSK